MSLIAVGKFIFGKVIVPLTVEKVAEKVGEEVIDGIKKGKKPKLPYWYYYR